jgi:hypothetical protein
VPVADGSSLRNGDGDGGDNKGRQYKKTLVHDEITGERNAVCEFWKFRCSAEMSMADRSRNTGAPEGGYHNKEIQDRALVVLDEPKLQ